MLPLHRPSSALGLEQPGDAADVLAPEPEKTLDAAVLVMVPATTTTVELSVPLETSAPADMEVERADVGAKQAVEEEPKTREASPEILSGEPIVLPPPVGTILHVARLIAECKVTGAPQQQPTTKDQDVEGTLSGNLLVTPPGWQYTVPAELIDDPIPTSEVLKNSKIALRICTNFPR